MALRPVITDDLLLPISVQQPAGEDLRHTDAYFQIREARREDDGYNPGVWEKREPKVADWQAVKQLATACLKQKTKDLQIAVWLTEALTKLHGWPGVRDSLKLIRELLLRFWDQGLYPSIEDGDLEFRGGILEWLNEKLPDLTVLLPLTARGGGGEDYSWARYQDALRVGSERDLLKPNGDIDENRQKEREAALLAGRISVEMWEAAVKATPADRYQQLAEELDAVWQEYRQLDSVIESKFGNQGPTLSALRTALENSRTVVQDIILKRNKPAAAAQVQVAAAAAASARGAAPVVVLAAPAPDAFGPAAEAVGDGWAAAEQSIRSGDLEHGLAEMTRLAAAETSGRARFQRKLLLAEVCLGLRRERLARTVLEELAEQIDKFQLEHWESSALVGAVWARLYRCYKNAAEGERAEKLYDRLCRLDPWQALASTEE